MDTTASATTPAPAVRRDRTHYLYLAVIVAVVAGIVVGLVAPDFGKELKPIGTGFVNLIKMMISPVIFCTIVLGVGSVRQAAKVGKVGGLALGYFLIMSTVALAIGLVVGNIIHPGAGLNLDRTSPAAGKAAAGDEADGTADFLLGIIPTTLLSSLTEGKVLQTLLVALLVGFAVQAMGRRGEPVLRAIARHPAAGLQGPRDDHVAGADRRVRRDGRGGRRDRRGRAQEPGPDHARLLRHLRDLRASSSWARCCGSSPGSRSSRCCATWAGSSC